MPKITRISILGCGWYGFALAKSLTAAGYQVKGSTTSPEKLDLLAAEGIAPYLVHFEPDAEKWAPEFFDCDVLFIAFPPKVKQGSPREYIGRMRRIIHAIHACRVQQVIFISSIAVYGNPNREVNEHTPPVPTSPSGRALQAAEELLWISRHFSFTILRFGGMIGPGRDPGRFFAGKKDIPNGQAPVNLIHLTDCIGISHAIIEKQAWGNTYNACSPYHPAKAVFYTQAAVTAGLALPVFRDELLEWKVVNSIYAKPILGYDFRHASFL
jgi:nucleoside-diphosphate-sugar epimerase